MHRLGLGLIAFSVLCVSEGSAKAEGIPTDSNPSPQNFIPLEVGHGFGGQINVPFVTVKICAPGTQICQSVSNILLDTGSTGLRLETRALNPEMLSALQALKDPSGNEIAECYEYAGNDNWWGRVAPADIYLGSDLAQNVSIELVDANYKTVPKDCTGDATMVAGEGLNGVLGTRFMKSDCYDQDCTGGPTEAWHSGMAYFACDNANNCTPYPMPAALQLTNPVYSLGADANGYIVEMPSLAGGSAPDSLGKVIFGIGTETNNQVDPAISNIALAEDDSFALFVNGTALTGFLDSGTNTYAFPATDFGILQCGANYGDYLCPDSQQNFTLSFGGVNAAVPEVKVSVNNAKALLMENKFAIDQLATDATEGYSDYFFLGMPFFYGRKVYFGFDVPNAPLGAGKHLGFTPSDTDALPL